MLLASVGVAFAAQSTGTTKKAKAQVNKSANARGASASAQPVSQKPASTSEPDTDTLRRAAQNPIANMISIPFQNNLSFGYGPYSKPQNVLNIQPVVPVKLTDDWNLITRWVTPLISQPQLTTTGEREFGLGNIQPSFFLSPSKPGEVIWGLAQSCGCLRPQTGRLG